MGFKNQISAGNRFIGTKVVIEYHPSASLNRSRYSFAFDLGFSHHLNDFRRHCLRMLLEHLRRN